MVSASIDDELLASRFRSRLLKASEEKVLISRLSSSKSDQDEYTVVNCAGYGRVREFKNYKLYLERTVFPDRPVRPNFRGYPPSDVVTSQVFQLAACNWRCWYCFVDDDRLSADRRRGKYFSAQELVDLYLNEPNRPDIIDLSGGQPDLVPEWTLWMVEECDRRSMLGTTHIWIDDNLSNDFLFRYLSPKNISRLAGIPRLSRMGCFKGFDELSFSFTTLASPQKFDRQFEMAKRIIDAGFRFYAYATFTTPDVAGLDRRMHAFVDRLQSVHELLPLWTTPLRIHTFAVTAIRKNERRAASLSHQLTAFSVWDEELRRRYSSKILSLRPDEVH